jgi:hypothetical protein
VDVQQMRLHAPLARDHLLAELTRLGYLLN